MKKSVVKASKPNALIDLQAAKKMNPTEKAYHAWVESICKTDNSKKQVDDNYKSALSQRKYSNDPPLLNTFNPVQRKKSELCLDHKPDYDVFTVTQRVKPSTGLNHLQKIA